MKTFFSSLCALVLALSAQAQNYTYQSFLNVRALGTGTNAIGITNLSGLVTNVGMVLNTNVFFTNNAGAIARGAAYTNTASTFPLFHDVSLWVDREGRMPMTFAPFSGGNPVGNSTNYPLSTLSLTVAYSSPWGSNGPIGINIAPIWDGTPFNIISGNTNFNGHPNTPTSTADDFSLVLPGGVGYTTLTTNLPIWKWPGARGLRIRNITNNFIQAGETAITNTTFLYRLGVCGYVP